MQILANRATLSVLVPLLYVESDATKTIVAILTGSIIGYSINFSI